MRRIEQKGSHAIGRTRTEYCRPHLGNPFHALVCLSLLAAACGQPPDPTKPMIQESDVNQTFTATFTKNGQILTFCIEGSKNKLTLSRIDSSLRLTDVRGNNLGVLP